MLFACFLKHALRNAPPRRMAPSYAPPTPEELGHAAALCWLDAVRDEQIAARLGITRRSLARWKRRPEFQAAYTAAALVWGAEVDCYRQGKD